MIYFIYGNPNKIFKKANSILDSLTKKNPEANILKINQDSYESFNLDELISGRSLFTGKQIVYLKKLFENNELSEKLILKIKEISDSQNIFIIVEEKLNKPILNKIEKNSEKVQKFESKNITKQKDNIFVLSDALGNRDSQKLWVLYQEKIKKSRPEEIHGILWWQIKSMISARKSTTAQNSGLKPFVYNKSKSFNSKYSDLEINSLADKFIDILQDSRRGGPSLEISLEKLILNLNNI